MTRLFALLLLAWSTAANAATIRGFELVNGQDLDAWSSDETAIVTDLLERLPRDLTNLPERSRTGKIRLHKTYAPESPDAHHAAPAILFWQLTISLSEAAPHARALAAGSASAELRKSYKTLLERRIVHHLLHVYDAYYNKSDSTGWRSLSGWRPRAYFGVAIPFLLKEADNQDPRGYGAELGLRSPEEDFVTFGELYFVTPDTLVEDSIACRTPEKYRYFRRLFPDYEPYLDKPHVQCRGVGEGFLDDMQFFDPITRKPIDLGKVDASTVSGFELLYATPGVGDAAEVAGHLVLRMKLKNNPQAERLGVENPNDLVLSFLADTEAGLPARPERGDVKIPRKCKKGWFDGFLGPAEAENQTPADFDSFRAIIQALKGLSGGFLTIFDRQTLAQAVRTYTIDQDRNLLRYELKLTEAQKAALIDRLYNAKKNYKTKYYFFDRNCASILVQLIGEALDDDEVAGFDPFVVPPNALVALLVRKNLAAPVHPAFYSFRKRGYVAQEIIKEEWPNDPGLRAGDEKDRAVAYRRLKDSLPEDPARLGAYFRLAALGQEAELTYLDKEQICEEMTTEATTAQRELLRAVLAKDATAARRNALDTNRLIYDRYRDEEERDALTGSRHTHLAAVRAGYGLLGGGRQRNESVFLLGGALHKQDMGSISAQSMQRATSVSLGEVSVALARDDDGDLSAREWRVTALSLRKLKERLYDVPSYISPEGSLGIGLTLLDARGSKRRGFVRSTLLGGELIANLWSSRMYNQFVYTSLGAAAVGDFPTTDRTELASRKERLHIQLPWRIEALWTFDDERRWQLRAEGEWRVGRPAGALEREITGQTQLSYRLLAPGGGSELLLWFGGAYHDYPSGGPANGSSRLLQIGAEWIPW